MLRPHRSEVVLTGALWLCSANTTSITVHYNSITTITTALQLVPYVLYKVKLISNILNIAAIIISTHSSASTSSVEALRSEGPRGNQVTVFNVSNVSNEAVEGLYFYLFQMRNASSLWPRPSLSLVLPVFLPCKRAFFLPTVTRVLTQTGSCHCCCFRIGWVLPIQTDQFVIFT